LWQHVISRQWSLCITLTLVPSHALNVLQQCYNNLMPMSKPNLIVHVHV